MKVDGWKCRCQAMLVDAGTGRNDGEFVPWRAKTLDRLLMKLDFLAENKEEKFEDALVNVYEDE